MQVIDKHPFQMVEKSVTTLCYILAGATDKNSPRLKQVSFLVACPPKHKPPFCGYSIACCPVGSRAVGSRNEP